MAIPAMPGELRGLLEKAGLLQLYRYIAQDMFQWITNRFDTAGDVTVLTVGRGVVLTSSSGQRWRVTIDNAGTLHTTAI